MESPHEDSHPARWLGLESLEDRSVPAAFTTGNFVIARMGDGAAALTGVAAAVFLDEYSPSGTLVQSIAMPTSGTGKFTDSGSASSNGYLTRSTDGRYVMLTGYDAAAGTAGVAAASGIDRLVARFDVNGNVDTSTRIPQGSGATGEYLTNNFRSVASVDGTAYWLSGAGSSNTGGVRYVSHGTSTGGSVQVSSTVTNTRAVAIFDGQLYVTSGSGSNIAVNKVGTGLPTTSGNGMSLITGASGATPDPYGFYFLDRDSGVAGVDTLYVANGTGGGGLMKYSFDGSTWTARGSISGTYQSVVALVNGTSADLYMIRGAASTNEFVKFTDSAAFNATITSGSPTQLAQAATNKFFRSLAFTPEAADTTPPTVSGVTSTHANGSFTVGEVIDIKVNFSENVIVAGSGSPQLKLAIGGAGRDISYQSGSGSSTLVFRYTVQGGDTSADLDYFDTASLTLGGSSTIKDAAGNNAVRTLASPGATNSLGANRDIVIDTTAPTVMNVTASPTSGSYKLGDTISITILFSEPVTVVTSGGTPTLALANGTGGFATYSSGSTTNTLTFTYTVGAGDTASDLDYTGTSALALNGGTIKDAATNDANRTLASPGAANSLSANSNVVVDGIVPVVTSITRTSPSITNASTATFSVVFSESVSGVGTSDFSLVQSGGVTGAFVASVSSGPASSYTVTVNTGSGDGSIRLDLTDDDTIVDGVGNKLAGTGTSGAANGSFTGDSVTVDKTPPQIASFTQDDATPTNAGTVHYTIAFTEDVTGFTQADLNLFTSGVSGASITGFTANSAKNYTITIGTGSGTGTVRLDLNDDDTVQDSATNPLNGSGSATINGGTYVIDRTAPAVQSITAASPNPSNAASIDFTVTFTEAVSGVDAGDFTLTSTGVSGESITGVTGGPTTWTVTVDTGSGDGTIRLDVADDDTIVDGAGNPLSGTGTGNGNFTSGDVYTIDKSAPSATSIARDGPRYTNLTQVSFTVTFDEPVLNVDVNDFSTFEFGFTSGTSVISATPLGANSFTVVVGTGSGDGGVFLDLIDNGTITDAAGNPLTGSFSSADPYIIDKTAPTVQSITRASPNPTNAASVDFTVVFSEDVFYLDATDFALTSTVTGASVSSVSGGFTTWTVTVGTGSGSGTIRLDVADNDTVVDVAGNPLGGTGAGNGDFTAGEEYLVDRNKPTVTSITRASGNPTTGPQVSFTVLFSEPVYDVDKSDFTLAAGGLVGAGIASVSGSPGDSTYTVVVDTGTGEGTLGLILVNDGSINDEANNVLAAGFFGGESYDVDNVAPTITSITRLDADPTNAASVRFQVLFREDVFSLTQSDFDLTAPGLSGASITGFSGSGDTYVLTAATGPGSGTIRLNFRDSDGVTDAIGNVYGGSGTQDYLTGPFYTVDRTRPTVSSVTLANPDPSNAASVAFTVTFSESVFGVDKTDFQLAAGGVSGASITNVGGTGSTRTVTVSTGTGDGTLRLDVLNDGTVADGLGNLLLGGTFTGSAYTIDKTAPTVTVTRAGGAYATTQPIVFSVVFSEPIDLPFTGSNITLSGTADLSGASISTSNPSSDRTNWFVSVGNVLSDGTVTASVGAGETSDDAGNPNEESNEDTVIYDATAPVVTSIVPNGPADSNDATVSFQVVFSEAIFNLDTGTAGNFTLVPSGVSGASITNVSGTVDPTVFFVTVDTGTGDGTLRLDLTDAGAIDDIAGNALSGAPHTGDALFFIDKTAPNGAFGAVSPNPRTTPVSSVGVTFNEAVFGLSIGDFTLTRNGGSVSLSGATLLGSGNSYTITGLSSATTADGDYVLTYDATTGTAADSAGNEAGSFAPLSFTVDATAPTVTVTEPTAGPTNASSLVFTVAFNEPVFTVDTAAAGGFDNFSLTLTGSLTGSSITGVTQTGAATYQVTVAPGTGVGTLRLVLKATPALADLAGNSVAGTPASSGAVSIDTVAPLVVIDDGDADNIVPNGAVLSYTIDVTDANPSIISLAAGDLSNAGTASISIGTISSSPISGGQRYTVPVTANSGGTIVLRIGSTAQFQDGAGNATALPQSDNDTVTVDAVAPTVTVNPAGGQPSLANAQPVQFTILFSEPVFGFIPAEAVLSGTAGGIGSATKIVTNPSADNRTYLVTVSGLTSDGTVQIDVAAAVAADVAGNLNSASTGSNVITLDQSVPTVTSIARSNPTGAATNAASVVFAVNFSEAVTGVGASDFSLASSGLSGAGIASVSGSGAAWFVTVNTGSGNGSLQLDLVDEDSILDAALNALGGTGAGNGSFSAGETYTVDRTAPTVSGIVLLDPSSTNLTTVRFRVTFSEPVQSSTVDSTDFSVATTGVTFGGVSVSPLTGGATASQFDVTVSGVAGNGSLGLNVDGGTAVILDPAGNALTASFSGPAYVIDQAAPSVTVNPDAGQTTFTNQQPVRFVIEFSEPVSGFLPAEAVLSGSAGGIAGATKLVTNPSADNRTYLVTISGLTSDGTVQIDVASGVAADGAGNLNSASTGSNVVTLDVIPPTVTSILRSNPAGGFTNATSVVFAVNFSESVTGVGLADFSLATSGLSGVSLTSVTGGGNAWFVTVNTGSGDGTLRLDLVDDDSVRDLATNRLGGPGTGNGNFTAGQTYTLDRSQPTVSNIVRLDPAVTNRTSVRFRVTFNEPVQVSTVNGTDFTPVVSGVSFSAVSVVQVNSGSTDTQFDVTVSGVSGNGSLRLDVVGGTATILDAAGNALGFGLSGPTYTIDQTAPTVTVNQAVSQLDPTRTQPIRYLIVFSEAVSGFGSGMISRSGTAGGLLGATLVVTNPSSDNRTFEVTVNNLTGDGTVILGVPAGALSDPAGNANAAGTFTDNTVTFDTTPPAVSVPDLDAASDSGPSPTDNITNDTTPTFSGTAEAGASITLLQGSTVLGTATATGGTWTITPATPLTDGAYNVFARATDTAGNVANTGTLSVTIDTAGPTVSVARAAGQGATANASSPAFTAQFAVTFSQSIPGLNASNLAVGGTAGGTITNVTGSGAGYTVTVGNLAQPGTVTINVNAAVAIDAAGNASAASPPGDQVTVNFTTQTQLQVTPADIDTGGSATATAVVSAPAGSTPGGSVQFALTGPGGVINRTINLAGGSVQTTFTSLAAGNYSVTATYQPASGYLTSGDGDSFTVEDPFVPPPPVDQNAVGQYAGVAGGTVTVYGSNGSILRTFAPFSAAEAVGGVRVAVADVNGDGTADVIAVTGPGSPALLRAFNGKTNAQLYQLTLFEGFTGGAYVAAGDLTGDDKADLVVTPDQGGGPRVTVFNGFTGAVITNFYGIEDDNFRGGARATVGDLNNDGVNDIVVSAGFQGGPRIAGFNGTTFATTRTKLFGDFFLFEDTLRNGAYVTIGDLNGDGFGDIIGGGGPGGAPRVRALDGRSLIQGAFAEMVSFYAGSEGLRGGVRVAAKDFDGDGKTDLVTGSGDTGDLLVYFGVDSTSGNTVPKRTTILGGIFDGVYVG